MNNKVFISTNNLSTHYLTTLRDAQTPIALFRQSADRLSSLLLFEALSDIPLEKKHIETPLISFVGENIKENIIFIPILRAGLSMLYQGLQMMPTASVGMFGLKRDEKTAIAHEYYRNIPDTTDAHIVFLDPMLATGGSISYALTHLKRADTKSIRLVSIVCAPEGIDHVHSQFPDLMIYTASIDKRLNSKKFIVPGLGDFGDRYFGTT